MAVFLEGGFVLAATLRDNRQDSGKTDGGNELEWLGMQIVDGNTCTRRGDTCGRSKLLSSAAQSAVFLSGCLSTACLYKLHQGESDQDITFLSTKLSKL